MSDRIAVTSNLREYYADFIEEFTVSLRAEIDSGGFLIIDSTVFELYRGRFIDILPEKRFVIIEATEYNKTIDKCKEIIEFLVESDLRKNERLIALGGGAVQDITAFAASILYRGIDWIFFPTTLLAQADSCIGSKTSINLGEKKNLVGNFYPPKHIYIDPIFIETLSVDDVKSGIGEIMHFYLYSNSPYFNKLIENYDEVIRNRSLLIDYMKESLRIKKSVIEVDEFDKGERNKFNYGHTFGHAIESITDYKVKHGQAVTIGMDIANYLSFKIGMMTKEVFNTLHNLLSKNFPEYWWNNFDLEGYIRAVSKDKKNIGTSVVCILSEGPGRLVKKQLPLDGEFKEIIKEYFTQIIKHVQK